MLQDVPFSLEEIVYDVALLLGPAFGGAEVADELDDLLAGGATDKRIVDENDALAFDEITHRVELELDAEGADLLLRLNERAALPRGHPVPHPLLL